MLSNAEERHDVEANAARLRSNDLPPRLFAECPHHGQLVPCVVIDLAARTGRCIGCDTKWKATKIDDEGEQCA